MAENHDAVITLEERVKHLCEWLEDIRDGKAPFCAAHSTEIKNIKEGEIPNLKASVKLVWSFIIPIIGWLLVISGLVVSVAAAAH
jgi:hypothetical protein